MEVRHVKAGYIKFNNIPPNALATVSATVLISDVVDVCGVADTPGTVP